MSRESEYKLNCHSLQALAIDASFFVCSSWAEPVANILVLQEMVKATKTL